VGHADEVNTSVDTKRVFASEHDGQVSIAWDYPGRTLLEVRILRSGEGFAVGPEPTPTQLVVYEDVSGSFRDAPPGKAANRYYTVFARQRGWEWHRWAEFVSRPEAETRGGRDRGRMARRAWPHRLNSGLLMALVLATLALSLAGSAFAEEATEPPTGETAAAHATAADATAADPRVAAVLNATGGSATHTVIAWTNGHGATVTYEWPAAEAASIAAVWPLATTSGGDGTPVVPYANRAVRLRIARLTGMRVDVLAQGSRVVQIMPADAATQFDLREQTWAPLSWCPWFTERPWVLLPLFAVIGAILAWRAWLRSRAWNRRLPSMTRHDRQFIGRLAVLLFLVAALALQIYESVQAATGPAADLGRVSASDLVALPLLLIPPLLLIAGLVLELSQQAHRFAWGLLAVMAAAESLYNLAAGMTGVVTNLAMIA
jgi:hypothetical protein